MTGFSEPAARTDDPAPESVRIDSAPTESFAALYEAKQAQLVRLAYLITGSDTAAQDIVQDVFVRFHPRIGRVEHPTAYLRRAVVNACVSDRRRLAATTRRKRSGTGWFKELGANELFDVLATLPARQRAAIVLRYWHDLSEAEIAEALGCRPGTVGPLLTRGTARLREELEHD